jgi:transposase
LSVTLEGRSKSAVALDYGISRYWVHQLVARYQAEGEAAFRPRSRRPHSNSRAVGSEVEDLIVRTRKELSRTGLDAGAETIRVHLTRQLNASMVPAVSTIWRILARRGFITHNRTSVPKAPGRGSRPRNRMSGGRPTPRTGSWPTARRWRS